MELYLMQHGEATSEEEDPARPLTETGRESVRRVAARAGAAGVRVDQVVHSGKLRAEQSAALLAEALGTAAVEARQGLAPGDPVDALAHWLRSRGEGAIAVVGHLPFLDRLASTLVAGDEEAHVVRFRNGGLVALTAEPEAGGGGYAVAWALVPELA